MKKYFEDLRKDKKKFYTSGVAILLLVVMLLASTYAFFKSTDASDEDTPLQVTTNTTDSLVFNVSNDITFTASPANFNEGMGNQEGITHATATLKANNKTNSATEHYYLYLDVTKNEFNYSVDASKPELLLQVTDPSGNEVTSINGLEYKTVIDGKGKSVSGFDITIKRDLITIADNYEITTTSEKTDNWDIKVILVNLESDQKDNGGKKFNGSVVIQKNEKEKVNTMMSVSQFDKNNVPENERKMWQHKSEIKTIVIENELILHDNVEVSYDISENEDGSVMAYLVNNGDNTYTSYIQADGKISLNQDSSNLFRYYSILDEIVGIENLDTYKVTDMRGMFYNCNKLSSLKVDGWNTSKVTSMSFMFANCNSLTNLDLSEWNTSNVTDMRNMFNYCSSLTNLDLNEWNTSQVTSMFYMFNGCRGLISLDVSGWDTSNVTDITRMFERCSSLTSLDVSNFDISKITNMEYLFYGCVSLTSLNVSGWNVANVTHMSSMFSGCSGLTSLNLSNFDTSKVIFMGNMFSECSGLTSLDLSNWDTSNVTDMSGVFYGCSSLTVLDVSRWNTANVTSMTYMFYGCSGLTSLDLSNWDTSNVTSMYGTFGDCTSLISLDFRNASFANISSSNDDIMFKSIPSNITILVGDSDAKTFIEARLAEANGGTVTVA